MPSADYRCRECGEIIERSTQDYPDGLPEVIEVYCYDVDEIARLDRVWSAPHTGSGSSGEPPH